MDEFQENQLIVVFSDLMITGNDKMTKWQPPQLWSCPGNDLVRLPREKKSVGDCDVGAEGNNLFLRRRSF